MESSFPPSRSLRSLSGRVSQSLIQRLLLLFSVIILTTVILSFFAIRYESTSGLKCLMVASGLCLLGGFATGTFDWLSQHTSSSDPTTSLMLPTFAFLFRMGLPLLACGMVALTIGPSTARSLARYLLVLYPVVVFTETWLAVARREFSQNEQSGVAIEPRQPV